MHAVAWGGAISNRGRHRVVDFREINVCRKQIHNSYLRSPTILPLNIFVKIDRFLAKKCYLCIST